MDGMSIRSMMAMHSSSGKFESVGGLLALLLMADEV